MIVESMPPRTTITTMTTTTTTTTTTTRSTHCAVLKASALERWLNCP
jgi:hypothetical protein